MSFLQLIRLGALATWIGTGVIANADKARAASTSAETAWLTGKTKALLAGCRVRADDGSWFYTPDGRANYRALWARDFAYMVENAGDLIPAEDVAACLRRLLKGVRADGAAPDRVQPDGLAVYVGGPVDKPLGEPNLDNGPFLVIAVDEHLKRQPRTAARDFFRENAATLDRAMDWTPRGTNGLVWNNPAKPHSPYGFTDTIGKTGDLFFESLLYWTASRRMAEWHRRTGDFAKARTYSARSKLIEQNLGALWDEPAGAFLAATKDCHQIDIWGNAYAIWLDFPLTKRQRRQVVNFLTANQDRFLWHGQVRHLRAGEYWQRLLTPVQPERYQNGAYWATASGWMMFALAQKNPAAARQMWHDLIADFRAGEVCECVNEGYRQLPSYVVSATNPLAAARRLKY